ncbi:hypothetical protein [Prosthecobacter sp.]
MLSASVAKVAIDCLRFGIKFQGLDQRLTGVEHHEPVKALLA